MKFILRDTFNGRNISNHRTVNAAVRARIAHAKRITRNSPGSYVRYEITDAAGQPINPEILIEIEENVSR